MKRAITALCVLCLIIVGTATSATAALSKPQLRADGARLTWQPVANADGYNVYRNNRYLTTVTSGRQYDTTSAGQYYIIAFDRSASGNDKWSPRSDEVTVSDPGTDSGSVCNGRVTFEDDFSGSRVDNSKWDPGLYWGFSNFGTGERQYYVRSFWDPAFEVSNGSLKVRARQTSGGVYLSGALTARTTSSPTFGTGCYEMRARFPDDGSGTWPALWLISNQDGLGSSMRPEIDVIEQVSFDPDIARFAAHYLSSSGRFNQAQTDVNYRSPDDWHTYSMRWSSSGIRWYLDGRQVASTNDTSTAPMHLHLNLAIGGWGGQNTISSGLFRGGNQPTMTVDYVKVTS